MKNKLLNKSFVIIAVLAALALLISGWSGYIDPRLFWPAAFTSLVFPYLYILTGVLFLVGLMIKNHRAWLLFILLIGFSTLFRQSFFNISLPEPTSDGLKILSHNIGSSLPANRPAEWNFYLNQKADILCFQEWQLSNPSVKKIRDSIEKNYYSTLKEAVNARPIFSKHPILSKGILDSRSKGNGTTWADILYHQDTLRIYNVHLVSNRISGQTEQLMNAVNIKNASTWQKIKRVLNRYKEALLLRTDQAEELKKVMDHSPHPFILAGDFNDIPSTYIFRLLSGQLNDAWLQSGNGLAYTYAGKLPFLHIDQVLCSQSLKGTNFTIHRVRYSDHFPVTATLKVSR